MSLRQTQRDEASKLWQYRAWTSLLEFKSMLATALFVGLKVTKGFSYFPDLL